MRVVSANGTILDLSPGKTVIHPKYPHETKQYIRWGKIEKKGEMSLSSSASGTLMTMTSSLQCEAQAQALELQRNFCTL